MRWPIFLLIGLMACQSGLPNEAAPDSLTQVAATPTLPIGVNLVTRVRPEMAVLATVQLPTATPLPPPTSTPSPTPIIYEIQAGDTLLDLAIQRGVTVTDIEALNPDVRPELLQVGQQVILPPPPQIVLGGPQATAVPPQLVVSQLQLYQMPTGAAWLVGEVQNEGEKPAEGVQVTVSLLSPAGEIMETVPIWVATTIVQGETAVPFGLLLPTFPENSQPAAAISAGQTMVDLGSRYLDLVITDAALEPETGLLHGVLINSGDATASQIRLTASLYNEAEQLIGFAQQYLVGVELAAGEQVPFTIQGRAGEGTTSIASFVIYPEALQK